MSTNLHRIDSDDFHALNQAIVEGNTELALTLVESMSIPFNIGPNEVRAAKHAVSLALNTNPGGIDAEDADSGARAVQREIIDHGGTASQARAAARHHLAARAALASLTKKR